MASIKIPTKAGALLLPNAVTFPQGLLPLHIFEPRYRKMLEDAIESNSMICVANLQSEETSTISDCVAKVGFIGIIRVSEKQDDGRSNLILHSISRVEFLSWESGSDYPKATIKPIRNIIEPVTESTEILIESLRDACSRFLAQFTDEVIMQADSMLDKVNEDIATLTDVIAQQFIADEKIRQSLLEERNPKNRAETLIRHLRTH